MGRPPCCDKVGIKKGPWTPEEDIILVSYIQEHGPGNWRAVPTNTGLLRCSKSCRLRWTNYLRPGIKRGNFTPHEEGMIIHLQALLGNKWAAIASYLPQRTDNDIKNYWNTHLKKKIKKFQSALSPHMASADSTSATTNNTSCSHHHHHHHLNQRRSFSTNLEVETVMNGHPPAPAHHRIQGPSPAVAGAATYASSTENISRLLEGWMRSSPKATKEKVLHHNNSCLEEEEEEDDDDDEEEEEEEEEGNDNMAGNSMASVQCYEPNSEKGGGVGELIPGNNDEFESILSFENPNDHHHHHHHHRTTDHTAISVHHRDDDHDHEQKKHNPPLSFLEKWLLDETAAHGEEMIDQLSPIF